jgi:hypothetical protein
MYLRLISKHVYVFVDYQYTCVYICGLYNYAFSSSVPICRVVLLNNY